MKTGRLTSVPATAGLFPLVQERRRNERSVGKLGRGRTASAVFLLCAATAIVSHAQTFKTIVSFVGKNGSEPVASLVQGTDGNLYGTTLEGGTTGPNGSGSVFRLTPKGTLTTLYSFCSQSNCADGGYPFAGLVQGTDGEFYGTTSLGGANSFGTVFKITRSGILTTLHSFCAAPNCTDGSEPFSGMIQGPNGEFYGTTSIGGANGHGTVFKITIAGKLKTIYSFCAQANCVDGDYPNASLLQVPNGELYGTTVYGGINGSGTVFKITYGGKLTTLHSFDGTDGADPYGDLVQAPSGDFYGTTMFGGANRDGTVFKMKAGEVTALYNFCAQTGCADGANPSAGLTLANDGSFYGTTSAGVTRGFSNGNGTVFKITPAGQLTTLHNFNGTDGDGPEVGLVQATNGDLYGTTPIIEVAGGFGTLFELSEGLRSFVATRPAFGKSGSRVIILGTNLTNVISVSFNGTPAAFTVVSKSEIKTTVPAGATTGKVEVTTPKKTLKSNVVFRITK